MFFWTTSSKSRLKSMTPIGVGYKCIGSELEKENLARLKRRKYYVDASVHGTLSTQIKTAYAITSFAGHIAQADGHFDECEREAISDLCRSILPKPRVKDTWPTDEEWQHHINEAMDDPDLADAIITLGRKDRSIRMALLAYAWRIAASDGIVTEKEQQWITNTGIEIGANAFDIEWCSMPYVRIPSENSERAQAAAMLGVNVDDDLETVHAAYKEAIANLKFDSIPAWESSVRKEIAEKITILSNAHQVLMMEKQGEELYGLEPENLECIKQADLEQSCCFVCNYTMESIDIQDAEQTRCPQCKALMYFDRETAEAMQMYNPPDINKLPSFTLEGIRVRR